MPQTIHDTFTNLNDEGFTDYSHALVNSYPTSSERKHAIAYLQMVNSSDAVTIRNEKTTIDAKRFEHQKKQKILEALLSEHSFDFTKQPDLFITQTPLTNSELDTLLTLDDVEVFIKGRQHVGDLNITGNSILISGISNGLSARQELLANTTTVLGNIHIAGDDCVIRGVDFTQPNGGGQSSLTFGVGAENITLVDCKFFAGDHIDSQWFYGNELGGNVTITNCLIENFKGVIFADFNSTSGVGPQALNKVKMKRCFFKNNQGSIAARGLVDSPTKLVSYTNNKFETTTLHAAFWDFLEANSALKVVVTDNIFTGPVGQELLVGKKGVLQTWSKSAKPWTLEYSGNVISNMKFGLKIVLINGFYSPNTSNDDHSIDLSASLTNVPFAASFLYKFNPGEAGYPTDSNDKYSEGSYTPVNISTFPSPPSVINPSAYAIVTV